MAVWKEMGRILQLPCREATELISRAMDAPLARHLRLAVWLHRMVCSACRAYRRQLLAMRIALRHLAEAEPLASVSPQPALSPEARERITRALRDVEGGD